MNSALNPLTVSTARLTETLNVSTISAYAAARLAVKGWSSLPPSAPKAFLYVGNMTNTQLFPETHTLGIAKNATAYFIETAAAAYQRAGRTDYRFYYVDERLEGGESVMQHIDGEAHALEFWKLVSEVEGQSHWCWTFVKGDAARGQAGRYVRIGGLVDREYRLLKDFGLGDLSGMPEGGMSYAEMVPKMRESGQFE